MREDRDGERRQPDAAVGRMKSGLYFQTTKHFAGSSDNCRSQTLSAAASSITSSLN